MQNPDSAVGLREFTERIVRDAMEKLHREACGEKKIGDDFELRACIVLARLAPILIAQKVEIQSGPAMQELPPDLDPAEAERLLDAMERSNEEHERMLKETGMTQEQWQLKYRAEMDAADEKRRVEIEEYEKQIATRRQ